MSTPRTFAPATLVALPLALPACPHATTNYSIASSGPDRLQLNRKFGQLMMVGFPGPEFAGVIRDALHGVPETICFYAQNIISAPQLGKSNDELGRRLDDSIEGDRIGRLRRARLELMLAHLAMLKTVRKLFNSMPSMELRLAILQRQDGNKVAMGIAQRSVTRLDPSAGFLSIDRNGRPRCKFATVFGFAIAATTAAIQSSGNERFD